MRQAAWRLVSSLVCVSVLAAGAGSGAAGTPLRSPNLLRNTAFLGQFSENVYRFGGARYFDVLGFHYFAGNSAYDFGWQVHYLREIMCRYGECKPIWDTEWGCGGAQPWNALVGGERFEAAFETKYVALSVLHDTVPVGHFDSLMDERVPLPRAVALALIPSICMSPPS